GWSERLNRYASANGPVIALVGFADRAIVTEAKSNGAVACLELPYNLDDLVDLIDRTDRSLPPEAWPLPARAEAPHALPPRPRRARRHHESSMAVPPWSESDRAPKLN